MDLRRRVAELDLLSVLAISLLTEIVLNRLAVPVLRPPGESSPPGWHLQLDRVGLFVFHFASVLALGALAWSAAMIWLDKRLLAPARATIAVGAILLAALAAVPIIRHKPEGLAFALESCFAGLAALVVAASIVRRADRRATLGLVVLLLPFLVHYYGTFALRVFTTAEEARWSALPDRLQTLGLWLLGGAAALTPLAFAPRPLKDSLLRSPATALAVFVAGLVGWMLRARLGVTGELLSLGLGVDLGPRVPVPLLIMLIAGALGITLSLATTLTSPEPGRRRLGVGLVLVLGAGYGYKWPLMLLSAGAGLLAIADGAATLGLLERRDDVHAVDVVRDDRAVD